jgi:two-component system NarL family sensor kinase
VLYEVSTILNGCDRSETALAQTVPLLVDHLGLSTAWVWLVENEHFYCAYAYQLPESLQAPVEMTGDPCWCIEAYQRGHLKPANLACSRLRKVHAELKEHATIPLASRGRALGILNVAGRTLEPDELRLLETFGLHLGTALDRMNLAEEAARLARSQERERVARELHDTLTQNLTGLTLQLEAALRRPSPTLVETALEIARESLESVRQTMIDLRAPELRGKTLAEAIRGWVRDFSARSGVRVELELQELEVDPTWELQLLRLVQEALQNVARHSGSSSAGLSLLAEGTRVILRCWDEGQGPAGKPGLGLTGMRERVAFLGGKLKLLKRPQGGTLVEIRL